MPYVLDTDTISALRRGNRGVLTRVMTVPTSDVFVTIVSLHEQIAGRLSVLNRPLQPPELVEAYERLSQMLDFYAAANILPYNEAAARLDDGLRTTLRRMGTNDRHIAAIALAHRAILVTGNIKDYRRVPGLVCEDWIEH